LTPAKWTSTKSVQKIFLASFLANMKGEKWVGKKHPWVKAHDTVWARVKAGSSGRVAGRFANSTEVYTRSVT
jgi:hypothetical protein